MECLSLNQDRPRIYVASLSDYNAGILHGTWIDATLSGEEIQEEVNKMLKLSKDPCAEEWAIHDDEAFEGIKIDEWLSFDVVSDIANVLIDGRYETSLIASLYIHLGIDISEIIDFIDDNYQGEHSDVGSWAESFLEETGALERVPKNLSIYIDFDKYGKDAEISGDVFTIDSNSYGKVHVFWSR
jgi:antirestriction protein